MYIIYIIYIYIYIYHKKHAYIGTHIITRTKMLLVFLSHKRNNEIFFFYMSETMCFCFRLVKVTFDEEMSLLFDNMIKTHTETKMSSFWRNFNHWLHWKLSFWQLPVQPVMKISSKWRHFRFSAVAVFNFVLGRVYLPYPVSRVCELVLN